MAHNCYHIRDALQEMWLWVSNNQRHIVKLKSQMMLVSYHIRDGLV
jgi:hypothetical protein